MRGSVVRKWRSVGGSVGLALVEVEPPRAVDARVVVIDLEVDYAVDLECLEGSFGVALSASNCPACSARRASPGRSGRRPRQGTTGTRAAASGSGRRSRH